MKEKKYAIGARISESIFKKILELESNHNMSRTNAITFLLSKGIENVNSPSVGNDSSVQVARRLTNELTNYKSLAQQWEAKYKQAISSANAPEESELNHDVVRIIKNEGLSIKTANGNVVIRNLTQLFNLVKSTIA